MRHLDRLPSAQQWTRPNALVVFDGLPEQPPGTRAVLMRPTREMLARNIVAAAIAEGSAWLLDRGLAPLGPRPAETAAYLALIVRPPEEPGAMASCIARADRP